MNLWKPITYHVNNLLFYNGYLYGRSENEIKILKYQPYFEDLSESYFNSF